MIMNRYTVIYHDGTETDKKAATDGDAVRQAKRPDKTIDKVYREVTE